MKVEPVPAQEDLLQRASDIGALMALVLAVAGTAVPASAADAEATRTVVAGARYAAGGWRAFFLGRGYRDLWAAPIEVPVLDLDTFAGGLTATGAALRPERSSLELQDASGRRYRFRS